MRNQVNALASSLCVRASGLCPCRFKAPFSFNKKEKVASKRKKQENGVKILLTASFLFSAIKMMKCNLFPFAVALFIAAGSLLYSAYSCDSLWEKSVITTRDISTAKMECLSWCREVYGVITTRVEYHNTESRPGFIQYNCYCDRMDCRNFIKYFSLKNIS